MREKVTQTILWKNIKSWFLKIYEKNWKKLVVRYYGICSMKQFPYGIYSIFLKCPTPITKFENPEKLKKWNS